MSYQTKYYFNFININDDSCHVLILQNTDAIIIAQEITGLKDPFIVTMPKLKNIFDVVRGTGCSINLLSENNMQFLDGLYFTDPFEYRVELYINTEIEWFGYLNSEMFREPFSFDRNYPVNISGNDGFSLMDRLQFLNTDGTKYEGIKSYFEIIQILFSKIALPYIDYLICLSSTFMYYSNNNNSTIIHETFVNCSNFYDEDGLAMTLRDVLESILLPLAAFIRVEQGSILITDVNEVATNNITNYKRFDYVTGAYISDIQVSNRHTLIALGYLGTGQSVEISGGVNKQVIAYSPYPQKKIVEESIKDENEFESFGVWSNSLPYTTRICNVNNIWEAINGAWFEESYFQDINKQNIYLAWQRDSTTKKLMSLKSPVFTSVVETGVLLMTSYKKSLAIRVEFEVMITTKSNPYDDSLLGTDYQAVEIEREIKIGNYYYGGLAGWTTAISNDTFKISDNGNSISDKFVKEIFIIPIQNTELYGNLILSGHFDFSLFSDIWTFKDFSDSTSEKNPVGVSEIWLKNIKITIVNGNETEISNNDIENIGMLDKNFREEGKKVTVKCGTNVYNSDKAMLMFFGIPYLGTRTGYYPITDWTRAGQLSSLEKLLLVSYISNEKSGNYKITNLKLKQFSSQSVLTDAFLPNALFMVASAKYNYADASTECELIEIKADDLTIIDI